MSIAKTEPHETVRAVEYQQPTCPTGLHRRLIELTAGEGCLSEALQAIVDRIADLDEVAGCFLAWSSQADEKPGLFVSSGLSNDLVAKLGNLGADGTEALKCNTQSILEAMGIFEGANSQIIGIDGKIQAVLVVATSNPPVMFDSIHGELLDTFKTMIATSILSAARSKAFGDANERFHSLVNYIPGVVYQRVVREDGNIRYSYISDAAEDLFGVSPKEILSDPQALFDCHGPEYYATFRDRLIEASKSLSLWDVEATIFTRSGKRKFTHAIARPQRQDDGSVVWNGVILDQTRIEEAELAAAAAEASTRDTIIESIPQAFALFDKNDNLVTWNTRYLKLYPEIKNVLQPGSSYADLVKAEIEAGIDKPPEDSDPKVHFYHRLAHHHQPKYEAERQTCDGHWILINEHRTAEGGTVVLHTDVTELKKREFALQQSNKELEAFASIASHDLQEPLRKIDAFGSRLQNRFADKLGDDGKMYINRMQSSVGRMRELINDLLEYSRVTTLGKEPEIVSLEEVVEHVIGDLQILIETNDGRVESAELPAVAADRTQMRQLFQNIIANALKFHRPGVPPVVQIWCEPTNDIRAGHKVRIKDNGIGFDMKYAERIFGIFQRLHGRSEYEGTGVGLATCRKIAERHGWTIQVDSVAEIGTTFTIQMASPQESRKGEKE